SGQMRARAYPEVGDDVGEDAVLALLSIGPLPLLVHHSPPEIIEGAPQADDDGLERQLKGPEDLERLARPLRRERDAAASTSSDHRAHSATAWARSGRQPPLRRR